LPEKTRRVLQGYFGLKLSFLAKNLSLEIDFENPSGLFCLSDILTAIIGAVNWRLKIWRLAVINP
jgi:hypothetical protein